MTRNAGYYGEAIRCIRILLARTVQIKGQEATRPPRAGGGGNVEDDGRNEGWPIVNVHPNLSMVLTQKCLCLFLTFDNHFL